MKKNLTHLNLLTIKNHFRALYDERCRRDESYENSTAEMDAWDALELIAQILKEVEND